MNDLQVFEYEGSEIRIIEKDSEPWWVAKDVCNALGITNNRDAISDLRDYEKDVAISDTLGGKQRLSIISESGLYRLILKSRKANAEKFQDWVCIKVLPSIRKNGAYSLNHRKVLDIEDLKKMMVEQGVMVHALIETVNKLIQKDEKPKQIETPKIPAGKPDRIILEYIKRYARIKYQHMSSKGEAISEAWGDYNERIYYDVGINLKVRAEHIKGNRLDVIRALPYDDQEKCAQIAMIMYAKIVG